MPSDPFIVTDKLSKKYRGTTSFALEDLTFQVNAAEVYGFLGANGAGKSTTIRTLLNFLQPTSGQARIMGHDSVRDSVEIKKHVGYLAGDVALYNKMTGQQFLAYMAELQPVKNKGYVGELIRRFEADTHKPLGELSKGNRQKFGLVQAVMHEPDMLILDEPTSGLDPLMQEEFFRLIHETKQRGASVLVSSHNFAEVQRMCDRIGFIRAGKMVAEQTLADLAQKAAHTFTLTFADNAPIADLKQLPHADIITHDDHHLTISLEGELTPLFRILGNHHVTRLEQQEVNLEKQFMHFYEGSSDE